MLTVRLANLTPALTEALSAVEVNTTALLLATMMGQI